MRKDNVVHGRVVLTSIVTKESSRFPGTMQSMGFALILDDDDLPTEEFVYIPPILMANHFLSENDIGAEYDVTYQRVSENPTQYPRVLVIENLPIKSTQFKG